MNKQLVKLFEKAKALKTGHFLLTSGMHSSQYVQCATIFENPNQAEQIVKELVPLLQYDIDTIVAPAIGGINLGYELAKALGCRFIFTERENGQMSLRRGFTLEPDERVLVVEDVVTTGGSVQEVLEIVAGFGCKVQGVAALIDRSNGEVNFGVPFHPLLQLNIKVYQPEECPLCAADIPLVKPGSR